MSFFDSLDRFVKDLQKKLSPKEVVRLRSCKNCPYYRPSKPYPLCTQTTPPTRILSEHWAQGCIYYGAEQPFTGLMTKEERESYASLLDRIKKIDLVDLITKISEITTIKTIEKLSEITNIKNLESLDLIDVITNIANIQSVDLIDEITKIGEITTLRDVFNQHASYLVNPSFEEDFVGWIKTNTPPTLGVGGMHGGQYLIFADHVVGGVRQVFLVPLGVDWLKEFYFSLRSDKTAQDLIRVYYGYTDQTSNSQTFQVTVANDWQKKTMTPTGGKYLEYVWFSHESGHRNCLLDYVVTVF